MKPKTPLWYLYVIRTKDNALYTGITTDVERRFQEHQSGRGAKYLKGKRPLLLVYSVQLAHHSVALKAEYRLKQLSKKQKEHIVATAPDMLSLLTLLKLNSGD